MGKGCAQSGGGPIPAPLGSSGYISLTPIPLALYIKPSYMYILMDRIEPLILGLPKSRTGNIYLHICKMISFPKMSTQLKRTVPSGSY